MPTNRDHKKAAERIGIGPTLSKRVDKMLDYPTEPFTGRKLDHREIHNWKGILYAYFLFGNDGARAALMHILMDKFFDRWNANLDKALYGKTYRHPT